MAVDINTSAPDVVAQPAPRGKKAPARSAPVGRRRTSKTWTKTAGPDTLTPTDADSAEVTDPADVVDVQTTRTPQTTPPDRGTVRRRKSWLVSGVAAVALSVVVVAAAAFFGYHYFTDDSAAPADVSSPQAVDTAKDYATKLASFDYRDLNKNRDAITAMSTPEFAAKYSQMVTDLTQIVSDGKGVATATVSHAAVERNDGSQASVMLFVDQQTTNVVAPTGKSQAYRMLVKLKMVGDHWLVDDVETK